MSRCRVRSMERKRRAIDDFRQTLLFDFNDTCLIKRSRCAPEYNYILIFTYKLLRTIGMYVLYRRFTGRVTHLKNYDIYVTSCFHRNRYRYRYRLAVFCRLNGTEDGIISIVTNFLSTIPICTMPIRAKRIFVKVFWRMFLIKVWKYNRIFNETILNPGYVYFSISREKIIRCLIIEDNRTSV